MRRLFCLFAVLVMTVLCCSSAFALRADTLRYGSRGESVRQLQEALISLGYLKGKADGIFGAQTEKAVKAFQKAKRLTVDGLAGTTTRSLLQQTAGASGGSSPSSGTSGSSSSGSSGSSSSGTSGSSSSSSGGSLFSGNYAAIRLNDQGSRVKILQQALIRLNYLSGKADGIFGRQTLAAVLLFQKENRLSADGLAGRKTLTALETADRNGAVRGSGSSSQSGTGSSSGSSGSGGSAPAKGSKAPDGSAIHLLHWFNDIKATLKGGSTLLIYDPSTGISWKLRVHSCGRHCDAEPLTKEDTENMVKAFGGKNTWDQKGVYVKLPSGVWTVGSTHDMPHLSGNVKDNGFNGHLCVHFLRDMEEAEKNDPNYGVANQKTIRALWKALSGEELSY